MKKYRVNGKTYIISESPLKNKEWVAKNVSSGEKTHFADPKLREFQGTKRGDSYCARSYGIAKKYNIKGNPKSPNFWSRQLWSCKGKKSVSKKRFFGRIKL